MSTASLPTYPIQPTFSRTPSYSAEPGLYEQRLALNARLQPRPTGNFVKSSKNGDAKLRLTAQQDNLELPVYGSGSVVEGTVELAKADNVTAVEVKVEGRLRLKEIAEGGHTDTALCLDTVQLWTKDASNTTCPSSLRFALTLPPTFQYENRNYALPPSHSVKLSGLPGFHATIDYSVCAVISKPSPIKKLGNLTISTPFTYYPRTRPAVAIPSPLILSREGGFTTQPGWRMYNSVLKANPKSGCQDIAIKVYIPASRIFCVSQSIPFHITFEANAFSLATFLPFSPTSRNKQPITRIQLMRQSTVDVRGTTVDGTKTDIWRVDPIGEGKFRHAGDGPTWMSFSGEIEIAPVKVTGFIVAGLSVLDYLLFTISPTDVLKAPFVGIREIVPVRLTTDPWSPDNGAGIGGRQSPAMSVPSSPAESLEGLTHAL